MIFSSKIFGNVIKTFYLCNVNQKLNTEESDLVKFQWTKTFRGFDVFVHLAQMRGCDVMAFY